MKLKFSTYLSPIQYTDEGKPALVLFWSDPKSLMFVSSIVSWPCSLKDVLKESRALRARWDVLQGVS